MRLLRPMVPSSRLLPDGRTLRTVQAPHHVKNSDGTWVVSSAAFSPSSSDQSLSVDLEQLLHADDLDSTALYPGLARSVGLYALGVGELRQLGMEVDHRPIWQNWYHGGVQNISHRLRKKMAKNAVAVIEIDQMAAASYQTDGLVVDT